MISLKDKLSPHGQVYQCPDCKFFSFLGNRMETHRAEFNHGQPMLVPHATVMRKSYPVTSVKPAPPLPPLHSVKSAEPIAATVPSAAALDMEREAGLVSVLARLSGEERLRVLAAIDLAYAQHATALACLRTVNIALSQATDKGTPLDGAICSMLAERTSKILKLTAPKKT